MPERRDAGLGEYAASTPRLFDSAPNGRLRGAGLSLGARVVLARGAEIDAVGESTQKGVELVALLAIEGGEEILLRRRDRDFSAPKQPLARWGQTQHIAPAIDVVAASLDEAAVGELGGDCGEVAAIEAERIRELSLAGSDEHPQLLEDQELLRADAERTHGAADTGGRLATEPGEERRHRHLLGSARGCGHGVTVYAC